jgi:hypothetical protein
VPPLRPAGPIRGRGRLGQGASQVEVRCPAAGVVPVRIRGGASQVRIRRLAGVPVRLRVGRGVADLRFDEQAWGAVGGGLRLATHERTQAPTAMRSRSHQLPRTWRSAPRKEATHHDPHHRSRRPAQAVEQDDALARLDLVPSRGQVAAVLGATANQ